jgi:hypothetical protein
MALQYIPDHLQLALDTWLSQDRTRPRFLALMQAICSQVQELEDKLWDTYVSTPLTAASGDGLDLWGRLLDEPREGADDSAYRRYLSARLLVLRSNGRIDELITIAAIIADGDVLYTTAYPAGFQLAVEVDAPLDADVAARLVRAIRAAKPGGVGLGIVERRSGFFRFDDPDLGFGSPLSRRLA